MWLMHMLYTLIDKIELKLHVFSAHLIHPQANFVKVTSIVIKNSTIQNDL